MQIDNILIVSPPNYTHSQALFDVAMSFAQSLPNKPELTINPSDCDEGTTLLFGAHLIPKFNATITSGDYIIYQSEQMSANGSLFTSPEYLELLRRYLVWDYSTNNIAFLESNGIHAKHVPIGYSKSLANIKNGKSVTIVGGGKNGKQRIDFAEWSGMYPITHITGGFAEDIDICFYGSQNERRIKIIDQLKSQTVPTTLPDGTVGERPIVVASFMGYGGFRDKLVARSKIVLNMHYYDSAIFEIFRCSHLFANKKCVVSETGKDVSLEKEYCNSGCFTDYDSLVSRCVQLLHDDEERDKIASGCNSVFKQKTQIDILKGIL